VIARAVTWVAAPVAPAVDITSAPLLRRHFTLDRPRATLVSAVLSASAWGTVELHLNGKPVSEDLFEPGWSSYPWRLRYRSYDVLDLIEDASVLVAVLGNGWYRGRLGFTGARAVYGDRLALIAQLELRFADGHVQTVTTDDRWESAPSPVLADDLYDGQVIDARCPGVRDACSPTSVNSWSPVQVVDRDLSVLVPALAPPVRRMQHLDPVSIQPRDKGRFVVDFGQNLVGWVRLRVQGPAGHEVVVRHSEVLQDGELATRPLRTARATDRYLLSGADDVLEPTLTFHGFGTPRSAAGRRTWSPPSCR
jgi:alpha-L-rhamnosidase